MGGEKARALLGGTPLGQLSCQEPGVGQSTALRDNSGQGSQAGPREQVSIPAAGCSEPFPSPPASISSPVVSQESLYPVPYLPGKKQTDLTRFLLDLLWPFGSGLQGTYDL